MSQVNKIYSDADFSQAKVEKGEILTFMGYSTGEPGGNIVQRYKDYNGNFGTVVSSNLENKQIVESLNQDGFIEVQSLPVAILTNIGNVYPIEKGTVTTSNNKFIVSIYPYLTYDNQKSFTPPWTIFYANGAKGDKGEEGKSPLSIAKPKITTLPYGTEAYVTGSIDSFQNITFDFGIPQVPSPASVKTVRTITSEAGTEASVTSTLDGTTKELSFDFTIPRGDTGLPAGFGTPTANAQVLPSGSNATVSVNATGDDTNKVFDFQFGIPKGDTGLPAGFGTPTFNIETGEAGSNASLNVTASGEDTSKVFNFDFTIPRGDTGLPAGFGHPTANAQVLPSGSKATVSVNATGDDTNKVFDFQFGIPKGDAVIAEIGDDGYWYIDGVKTNKLSYALGSNIVVCSTPPASPFEGLIYIKSNDKNEQYNVNKLTVVTEQVSNPLDGTILI